MTTKDRRIQAQRFAEQMVQDLRKENEEAELRGAPKVPDEEYKSLEKTLARKLIRSL